MANNYIYSKAIDFVLQWEGGWVNDPSDPGGETKYGISKRAYPNVNIKELTLEQAKDIYYKDYWQATGCNEPNISDPLACVIFDTAVNMGVGRAKKFLKETQDYKTYIELRKQRYLWLVNRTPALKKFLKGWINRITDLRKLADIIALEQ